MHLRVGHDGNHFATSLSERSTIDPIGAVLYDLPADLVEESDTWVRKIGYGTYSVFVYRSINGAWPWL